MNLNGHRQLPDCTPNEEEGTWSERKKLTGVRAWAATGKSSLLLGRIRVIGAALPQMNVAPGNENSMDLLLGCSG